MGWLIVLWIFLALAALLILVFLIPVGIRVRYDQNALKLWYNIGPIRLRIPYPKNDQSPNKEKKSKMSLQTILGQLNNNTQTYHGILGKFWTEMKLVFSLFGYLRPKLRIKRLVVKLHLAGSSPDTLAMQYGSAWAAIGGLIPLLEEAFILKKREPDVDCDFEGSSTTLEAKLDISIGLGRLLLCLVRFGMGTLNKTETKQPERR